MASSSSKRKGLNDDEKRLVAENYGRITHYFEKSKCLDINVDAEYEQEAKFAIHFFEDEQIKILSSKLRKITLWIECGSFLAVNLWHKMENIIKLLNASKYIIHHLNLFLTHESGDDSLTVFTDNLISDQYDIQIRKHLFEEFMKSILESSTYKLNYINFNIEGIERDLNSIYISYLTKLLMPTISKIKSKYNNKKKKKEKKEKNNTITGIKLAIFGNKMFKDFCDDKNKRFSYAIIATSTLKSLSITFENIGIGHKLNSFLHSISLNNYISSLFLCINDKGNFKNKVIRYGNLDNMPNNMRIVTSFYVTLYAIFTNKWKHLKSFCLEYNISKREYKYNWENNMPLCNLDNAELMTRYVLQPIINKAHHLTEFEWRVDTKWNEINLSSLCQLFDANENNKLDFEFINISKIYTSNTEAMKQYLSMLKQTNRCKELKLSRLNGILFTEVLCDFIATDCGSTFETLRFRMKYDQKDVCCLGKHTMLILNSFILHLKYLYNMYNRILPLMLSEYGDHMLPEYLVSIIVDFCKMRCFKLDFSLLRNSYRKVREPLTEKNLEQIISMRLNELVNELGINKNGDMNVDYEQIVIKKDGKNDHPLLQQLFQSFIHTPNVNFNFTAIDCRLLFSINP